MKPGLMTANGVKHRVSKDNMITITVATMDGQLFIKIGYIQCELRQAGRIIGWLIGFL